MPKKKSRAKAIPGDRCLSLITVFGFDSQVEREEVEADSYTFDSYRVALFEFRTAPGGYALSGWLGIEELLVPETNKRKAASKQAQKLAKELDLPLKPWEELQPSYLGELEGMASYYDLDERLFLNVDPYAEDEEIEDYLLPNAPRGLPQQTQEGSVERELLGYVSVDRGMVVIADPSYLGFWKNEQPDPNNTAQDFSFSGAENAAKKTTRMGGQLYAPFQSPEAVSEAIAQGRTPVFEAGVAVSTGLGDGIYPVYAEYQNLGQPFGKRVVRVTIDFTHHILLPDSFDMAKMMH